MSRPYVLIHQARPSHQILLHQAFNAQGIFNVRITEEAADLHAHLDTVPAAFNTLGERELCPGAAALAKINAGLR